jgi:type II secretion system protein H
MEETGHTGFTLIELLVTLAVAALLAAMAVPAMSQYVDNSRLRGAAEQLLQDLRQARNRAVTHRQDVYISFATLSPGWCYGRRARKRCDCSRTTAAASGCSGDAPGASTQVRSSQDFPQVALHTPRNSQRYDLRFGAVRGLAEAGSLQLENRAGRVRVIVSPLGRVRACALEGRAFPPC